MSATRTQREIVERIAAIKGTDFLGFATDVLIGALDFEHAKPFLKPDTAAEDWPNETSDEDQRQQAVKYLAFAWGKAGDHRGISASRSVVKLTQWAWLLGLDEIVERMEHGPYAQYGAPALKAFSEAMEIPLPTDPDLLRMMDGLPCREGCEDGCGR